MFNKADAQVDATYGKQLFTIRCAACHSVAKDVTGPALRDVDKRHTEDWIIKFVHGSQSVIKSGDTIAVKLFEKFNKTIMPNHPDLSNNDIKSIIAYIKEEGIRLAVLPAVPKALDDDKPYSGKSSPLHQLIYLDIPGEHRPLNFRDPFIAVSLVGVIISLVLFLLLIVKTYDILEKYKQSKE
ncbi:hypothetical protein GCM10022209_54020 [Chitinophaga oryziterrae]